jgi:hypothetical protein
MKPKRALPSIFFALGVFGLVFLIYQQTAALLGHKTVLQSYWDLLARALLDGKPYLTNPPDTYDLTFYQGHWYVPQPPLPALLMLPWVVLSRNTDPILFSISFSALNAALLFLIFDRLSGLGWITTSRSGILWLVALFTFGTPHLWVGMSGKVWFVSQVVTVTFTALAIYCALKSWSPWLVGLGLGLAAFSRPNVLVLWPVLLAIQWQLMKSRDEQSSKKLAVTWSLKTFIPIGVFVLGIFIYNWLRFGNLLDFGYATINGDPALVNSVQQYGMFSPHFMARNLNIMFLKLPEFTAQAPYVAPSPAGMSLFLTTPAFFYLVPIRKMVKSLFEYVRLGRAHSKSIYTDIWILGGWVAVILSLSMLSMYSNSGWIQFGYRYILDFIIPLMMLMAVRLKGNAPWHLVVLIILSILINLYGNIWYINII